MKYDDIETFLKIYDVGSIVKAAESLYIGQGTASTRIKQLETELGITLFHRQKGIRKIALTQAGEEFLPIAQQWFALWQDANRLKDLEFFQELKIAATDLINMHTFAPLYQDIAEQFDEIVLTIKTHHSSEIHRQVDNQLCDIGFCINRYKYQNIITTPLYRERMVLVTHKQHLFNKTHDINDLSLRDEIYLASSKEYEYWHKHLFKSQSRRHITVGTVTMQISYLKNINHWTIIPISAAQVLIKDNPQYTWHEIKDAPSRIIYLLTYKYPRAGIKKATSIFIDELIEYLNTLNELEIIYNNQLI